MIVAEDLTKRYGPRLAVDHVSFRVPAGEVVGFLGPNGAGKSTTLKMVSGFLPPTSGTVTVAGYDVVEESLEARRQIGYMPEAVPLYPEMRVEEYLAFRAEIKGVASRARKAAVGRAMEQADVADVARRLIGELSKGYKQRVGLADALVASPKLLILDEPTAGLDPNQILQVRELIKSLGRDHTIFISTHILPEVEAVCSRVVIVRKGKVVAEGTADEIRTRMTGSGQSAELLVRGLESKAAAAIASVSGVSVQGSPVRVDAANYRESSEAAGVYRFLLQMPANSAEAAEGVVAACVAAGVGVRGLDVRAKSLETIFHELTTSEPEVEGDAKPSAGKSAGESSAASKPSDDASRSDGA